MEKLPPIEKIYEAYSAIADGRVSMVDGQAAVTSSDGAKAYTVIWEGGVYSSNDNATYWRGYAGYPVVAVLMLRGKLTLDKEIAELFSGVNWTERNKAYKQNYALAVESVVKERGYDLQKIHAAAARVMEELKGLEIQIKRGKLRPPSSKEEK